MFAALTCIATMIIKFPTIGTSGYINIGDCMVLLSAWILGNPYGAIAAALGSGLADLLSGYAFFVPGTVFIKFLMAFLAAVIAKAAEKAFNRRMNKSTEKTLDSRLVICILSGIVAEIIMVAGYFVYEAVILGYGFAAVTAVVSNLIQGTVCILAGTVVYTTLSKLSLIKDIQ